jgi:hypothetical protein
MKSRTKPTALRWMGYQSIIFPAGSSRTQPVINGEEPASTPPGRFPTTAAVHCATARTRTTPPSRAVCPGRRRSTTRDSCPLAPFARASGPSIAVPPPRACRIWLATNGTRPCVGKLGSSSTATASRRTRLISGECRPVPLGQQKKLVVIVR